MEAINRRTFITRSSAVVAAVGVAAIVPGQLAGAATKSAQLQPDSSSPLSGIEMDGPVIAQIKDLTSGEIAIFSGSTEVTLHDRQLAARLARAAVRK